MINRQCDIHATNSTDFTHTLAECKELVLGAGGKVIKDFAYPGGFLYLTTFPVSSHIKC